MFEALSFKDRASLILNNLEELEKPFYSINPNLIYHLTTNILRAYCGCSFEPIFDELAGEWIEVEGHSQNCHRLVYPIEEDLSARTIERRKRKTKLMDHATLLETEEKLYATRPVK